MHSSVPVTGQYEPETAVSRSFEIVNKRGLHVRVSKDGMTVGGTSIMGLMMLAASPGCCIDVSASGEQADAVLDALQTLIADKFGEEC